MLRSYFSISAAYCSLTKTLGRDSAAVQWVYNPVEIFECVHDLQYSSNSADGVVDVDGADEFCGQVGVENQLYLLRAANRF